MKITIINKSNNKRPKEIKLDDGEIAVYVTEKEAIVLIHSLTEQITKRNSNSGRDESYSTEGTYFTIYVTDFKMTEEEHIHEKAYKKYR